MDCLDESHGYVGLPEAGVRIFEWQGPMLHAKTTVVDGMWCRVGSSNLNLASLLTNWELDVVVEDEELAAPPSRCTFAIWPTAARFTCRPVGHGKRRSAPERVSQSLCHLPAVSCATASPSQRTSRSCGSARQCRRAGCRSAQTL